MKGFFPGTGKLIRLGEGKKTPRVAGKMFLQYIDSRLFHS
jgi:hypothetical protein